MVPTQISGRLFSPRDFFRQVFSGLRLTVVSVCRSVLLDLIFGCSITFKK